MWIDAICINQKDNVEKGAQVDMMGKIYRRASRVIAWLGPSADDSDVAMSEIALWGSQVEVDLKTWTLRPGSSKDTRDTDLSDVSKPMYFHGNEIRPISVLLGRPWFSRLWIRQEIFLANSNAIISCGASNTSWKRFRNGLILLHQKDYTLHNLADIEDRETTNKTLFKLRQAINRLHEFAYQRTPVRIGDLRENFKLASCKDPQDRIYAILSMLATEDRKNLRIMPDYTSTVAEVYKDFTSRSFQVFRNIDLLLQCEIGVNTTKNIPTWVPDWSRNLKAPVPLNGAFASSQVVFRYDLASAQNVLRVAGVRTTVVESVGPGVYDGLQNGLVFKQQVDMIRKAILATDTLAVNYEDGTALEILARTLNADWFSSRYNPPPAWVTDLKDGVDALRQLLSGNFEFDRGSQARIAIDGILNTLVGRCLGRDVHGSPILCPRNSRPGDEVCVFLGCLSAILLRRIGDSHVVVGSCLTVDSLDGVALLGPLPQGVRAARVYDEEWHWAFVNDNTGDVSFFDPRLDVDGLGYIVEDEKRKAQEEGQSALSVEFDPFKKLVQERTGRELQWFELI